MKYVELFRGKGKDIMYIAGNLSKEEVIQYKKQGYKNVSGGNVRKNGIKVVS